MMKRTTTTTTTISVSRRYPQKAVAAAILAFLTSTKGKAWISALRRKSVYAVRLLLRVSLYVGLKSSSQGVIVFRALLERCFGNSNNRAFLSQGLQEKRIYGRLVAEQFNSTQSFPILPRTISQQILNSFAGFSFAGCSWLLYYHLGVARALENYFGHSELEKVGFAGASSGSLMAAGLATGVSLDDLEEFAFEMIDEAVIRFGGPIGNMSTIVREGLMRLLPENAIDLASLRDGRLVVSVTSLRDLVPSARFVTGDQLGKTREELISTLLASCYIPFYYEEPALFWDTYEGNKGEQHRVLVLGLDGGLADWIPPVEDEQEGRPTVRISPYNFVKKQGRENFYIVPPQQHDPNKQLSVNTSSNATQNQSKILSAMESGITEDSSSSDSESMVSNMVNPCTRSREPYPYRLTFLPTQKDDYEQMLRDGYEDASEWILSQASTVGWLP